jgi:hypothetical protein
MDVDKALRRCEFRAAKIGRQLVAGNHVPGRTHENVKDIKFDGSHLNTDLASPDLASSRVEPDLAHLDGSGADLPGPPQNGPYARQQFMGRKWLRDVIVGTGV